MTKSILFLAPLLASTAFATTFTYTGFAQYFTVQPGTYDIVAYGAAGGAGSGPGGLGAEIGGYFTFAVSEALIIDVGGQGGTDQGIGGGGGGSFIVAPGSVPLVVAGAGGGGGAGGVQLSGGENAQTSTIGGSGISGGGGGSNGLGGAGGGTVGAGGGAGFYENGGSGGNLGGTGGNDYANGLGGGSGYYPGNGGFGGGGGGGLVGGGGGGGYSGGGGGGFANFSGGGGGGGGSYLDPSAFTTTLIAGVPTSDGNGLVTITPVFTTVPEPASALLLTLGAAGLALASKLSRGRKRPCTCPMLGRSRFRLRLSKLST